MLLEVNNIRKVYTTRLSTQSTEALKNVNFSVDNGEYVAIMGESGSGKTTLLNILATFDKATSGSVLLNNLDLSKLKDKELADFRRDNLGIDKLINKYPYEISGGQRQRVAVARAIITNPSLILADEPTGALDSKSTDQLLNVFDKLNEIGQTIIMVTHSVKTAARAKRVLFIKDGVVFHELRKGNATTNEMFQKINDTLSLMQAGE